MATTGVLTLALLACSACRHRGEEPGRLSPPKDARAWTSNYAVAFDDSFTPTEVNLSGRAPNDVQDQRLFSARLGHADLVMVVEVRQVWGKGRHEGRQNQFLDVTLGEVLLGQLDKEVDEEQLVEVVSEDDLPGSLKGETMLLFLRWDNEGEPPWHHHLMPAQDDTISLIRAMVAHAEDEGVLEGREVVSSRKEKRKRRKERKKTERNSRKKKE
jgi:hypothetical protein